LPADGTLAAGFALGFRRSPAGSWGQLYTRCYVCVEGPIAIFQMRRNRLLRWTLERSPSFGARYCNSTGRLTMKPAWCHCCGSNSVNYQSNSIQTASRPSTGMASSPCSSRGRGRQNRGPSRLHNELSSLLDGGGGEMKARVTIGIRHSQRGPDSLARAGGAALDQQRDAASASLGGEDALMRLLVLAGIVSIVGIGWWWAG